MGFFRQDYQNKLPFSPPGDLTQQSNPCLLSLLHCRQILYCRAIREAYQYWMAKYLYVKQDSKVDSKGHLCDVSKYLVWILVSLRFYISFLPKNMTLRECSQHTNHTTNLPSCVQSAFGSQALYVILIASSTGIVVFFQDLWIHIFFLIINYSS